MADGTYLISWTGVASSLIGGVIHLLAWRKGKEAAHLETVEKIDRISGKPAFLSITERRDHNLIERTPIKEYFWMSLMG